MAEGLAVVEGLGLAAVTRAAVDNQEGRALESAEGSGRRAETAGAVASLAATARTVAMVEEREAEPAEPAERAEAGEEVEAAGEAGGAETLACCWLASAFLRAARHRAGPWWEH